MIHVYVIIRSMIYNTIYIYVYMCSTSIATVVGTLEPLKCYGVVEDLDFRPRLSVVHKADKLRDLLLHVLRLDHCESHHSVAWQIALQEPDGDMLCVCVLSWEICKLSTFRGTHGFRYSI